MIRNDSALEPLDKDIFNHVLPLGDKDVRVGDLLGIDNSDVSYEFSTQAARLVWVATLAAVADVDLNDAKLAKDVASAQVELRIRRELSGEKTTEAYIRALVTVDQEYMDVVATESDALLHFKIMRAVADAMRQRGDMLVSLGANLRQELEMTGMHINETKTILRNK